jgi:hypothetical protein
MKYPRMVYTDVNGGFCKVRDGPLTSADHLGRLEENGRGNRERPSKSWFSRVFDDAGLASYNYEYEDHPFAY